MKNHWKKQMNPMVYSQSLSKSKIVKLVITDLRVMHNKF